MFRKAAHTAGSRENGFRTLSLFLRQNTENPLDNIQKQKKKGGSDTGNLTETLMEELNCETVFTLPVLGGISESVVVTWIIMAVLVIASIFLTRGLKVENPGKVQLVLESAIGWAQDFFEGIIGKANSRYIPYLITVLLFLGVSNTIALLGFKPPTKDLNVTAALAIMSMCLIEFSGIRKNGLLRNIFSEKFDYYFLDNDIKIIDIGSKHFLLAYSMKDQRFYFSFLSFSYARKTLILNETIQF